MPDELSVKDRKRLWTRAGDSCAFTGCDGRLLHPATEGKHADTIVGEECHIVARSDDPKVARSLSSLSDEEKTRWSELIEKRHGYPNRVLMCRVHARVIDDPDQGYTVARVIEMKRLHEEEVDRRHHLPIEALRAGASNLVSAPLLAEDVGYWQRKAWRALKKADPVGLNWLIEQLGSPAEKARIATLVAEWPEQLENGVRELPVLLAREAEAAALWVAAADAWERIALIEDVDGTRADFLARAAIDAGIGGDTERHERLLDQAEIVDPACVRAKMVRIDDSLKPSVQLAYLGELRTDDPALASMLACRRALAYLQDSDLAGAEREAKTAEELDPDSVAVQVVLVNLELHEARVALVTDRPFVVASVLAVHERALELREQLAEMGRFEESVRLLMMAADARSLLRDQDGARATLEEALPQEISADQGAAVLGDAALRCDAPKLALRFVEGGEPDEGLRRISATARADLGAPGGDAALTELEELALAGGEEAEAAAAARLILCMVPTRAPWHEDVAAVLEGGEFDRYVKALRTLALSDSDPEAALAMAWTLPAEAWAAEVRVRVAGVAEDDEMMLDAAKEFLGYSPDGAGRILAARGLARGGDLERASEVCGSVARDPNTPAIVRSDGFHFLLKTLADRDAWEVAERAWEEWRDFGFRELPTFDGRISAWQVRVIHNRPSRPSA